ncbi:MAG: fibronectin type III domain-containing protein, partial [Bacteroidota bacterium]
LLPVSAEAGDLFGASVAVDGERLVIGAPGEGAAGAVYVFQFDGADWIEDAKLLPPTSIGQGAAFGGAVSVSNNVVLVGALQATGTGRAYVFTETGESWNLDATLSPDAGPSVDRAGFGGTVMLEGAQAFVGAPFEAGSGRVYVYDGTAGSWTFTDKLAPLTAAQDDRFGASLSVFEDELIIGVPRSDVAAQNVGEAYVYQRAGSAWVLEARLLPSDVAPGLEFGSSVAADGGFSLIGARGGETVFSFERVEDVWLEQIRIGPVEDETEIASRAPSVGRGAIAVRRRRGGIGSPRYNGGGEVDIIDLETFERPTLGSPSNGTPLLETNPLLEWNPSDVATGYRIQVSRTPDFSELVVDADDLNALDYQADGLLFGTEYFWRVRVNIGSTLTTWSLPWRFVTVPGGTTQVVPGSPADGSERSPAGADFSWNRVDGASTYAFQLSTFADFEEADVRNEPSLADTAFSVLGLQPNTVYYWRVRASNASASNWSESRQFTTNSGLPGRPVLLGPENDASLLSPGDLQLSWEAVGDATGYFFEVSTSSRFEFSIANGQTSETDVRVEGLRFGTEYFWRIQAANSFGIGSWSTVRRFVTEPGGSAQVVLESPTDGASDVRLPVEFTWGAVDGAGSYQIQVSEQANFLTTVVDEASLTGTVYEAEGLAPNQTYYWRVRASNAGANNWSESRRLVTGTARPARVSLQSPEQDATEVSIRPTLRWNAADGAETYRIQVATDEAFAQRVADESGLTGRSFDAGVLAYGSRYYWRVRAVNAFGNGAWSTAQFFLTERGGATQVQLASPENGADGAGIAPTLSWAAVDGAETYRVEVSSANDFTAIVFDEPATSETSVVADGLEPNTTYYWRVRASNAGSFNWSETRRFETGRAVPAQVALVSPRQDSVGVGTTALFSWTPVFNATSYVVQISNDADFIDLFIFKPGVEETALEQAGMLNGKQYYWRVQAANSFGVGAWSEVRFFQTERGGPAQVQPAFPEDGAEVEGTSVSLHWRPVAEAESYRLQVSTTPDFATALLDRSSVEDTTFQTPALDPMATYYWRVRASNAEAFNWSPTFAFTTGIGSLAAPGLVAPADRAVDVPSTPEFVWRSVPGATSYRLDVSTSTAFTDLILQVGVSDTTYVPPAFALGQTYYWRVTARNATRQGISDIFQFTIIGGVDAEAGDIPETLVLGPNYPNPFNPRTVIPFALPSAESVRLVVYDVAGREVAVLADGFFAAGRHEATWTALDAPSGLYFYRLTAGEGIRTGKMMLAK